jgi:hypothetical protein
MQRDAVLGILGVVIVNAAVDPLLDLSLTCSEALRACFPTPTNGV